MRLFRSMLPKITTLALLIMWLCGAGTPALAADATPAAGTAAHARNAHHIVWLLDGYHAHNEERRLRNLLSSNPTGRHLVGEEGIRQHMKDYGVNVPDCLDGTGTCTSDRIAAMRALGVQLLVRIHIERSGHIEVHSYDNQGETVQKLSIEASNTRAAIMKALAQITGATGNLRVRSTPSGATVLVDGKKSGTTPLNRTMKVGAYHIEVRYPGYGTVQKTIDIPPEGSVRKTITLEPRQATLIVHSGTPTAYVRIDDHDEHLPLNQPLLIDAGHHRVSVEAKGYEPVSNTYKFVAGQTREFTATLALSIEELTQRHKRRIQNRPLLIQAGLRYMHNGSDWRGARTHGGADHIACAVRPTTGACERSSVHSIGLDLEAIYTWKHLEIEPLGLSFYALAQPSKAVDFHIREQPGLQLSHVGGWRTLVRIGHVGARYLINDVFEPYGRAGFSFAADRIRAKDVRGDGRTYRFQRAAVLFEIRGGMRVHVNELLYGYVDLGAAIDLTHKGTRSAFEMGVGVGVNLHNPFSWPKNPHAATTTPPAQGSLPEEL